MTRITQKREYYIVKRNDLIRKSRYSLSVQQQKMLYYLISQIKPMDEENYEYEININDFCKLCGYDTNNGYYYTATKEDLKALADKSAWIDADDGTSTLFRWIDTAVIKRNSGVMKIKFHSTVAPYLFELRGFYTQYSLFHLLAMKCKYSMRMYEYLLSLKYQYQFKVDIDELKKRIDAENYDKYFTSMLEEKGLSYELVTEFTYNLIMSKESELASNNTTVVEAQNISSEDPIFKNISDELLL